MNYGFHYFHPLKGTPPDEFNGQGEDIIQRARKILSKRSLKEIKAGADLLNYLFSESNLRDWELKRILNIAKKADALVRPKSQKKKVEKQPNYVGREFIDYEGHSEVRKLFLFRNYFDLTGYKFFPNATWPEVFAILALTLIDKACDDDQYYRGWVSDGPHDWLHHHRVSNHIAWWMIDAVEAVALAEGLKEGQQNTNQQEQTIKARISIRARSAAIAKHAKTAGAIRSLVEFGRQLQKAGKFKSKRNTVSSFLSSPQAHLANHLAASNRSRTLYEGYCKVIDREPPPLE